METDITVLNNVVDRFTDADDVIAHIQLMEDLDLDPVISTMLIIRNKYQ